MALVFLVSSDGEGGFTVSREDDGPPIPDEEILLFRIGLAMARLLHREEYIRLGVEEMFKASR